MFRFSLLVCSVALLCAFQDTRALAAPRTNASSTSVRMGKVSRVVPQRSSATSVRSTSAQAKGSSVAQPFMFSFDTSWMDTWKFYVVKTVARATALKHESSGKTNFGEVFDKLDLSRSEVITEPGGAYPSFLRVKFPKGGASPFNTHFLDLPPSGVWALACPFAPSDDLYLRYAIRFPAGFDFSSSGALPAIAGGILNQAEGTHSNSYFRLFFGWDKQGEMEFGGFRDALQTPRHNSTKFSADGQWHIVEMYVRSNVAPMHKMNGAVEIRYDGETILAATNAAMRIAPEHKFECVKLVAFAGALDAHSSLRQDSFVDIAGMSTSPKATWWVKRP